MFPYSDYIIVPVLIVASLFFINKGEEHKVNPSVIGAVITLLALLLFILLRKFTDIRTGFLLVIIVIFWIGLTLLKNLFYNKI